MISRKSLKQALLSTACACAAFGALAADPVRIGLILPMSGPFASTGAQIETAVRLYLQQNGDSVAGRKIEVILKDDGGTKPDLTKKLAQELVTKDKVQVLAGFGLTPLAYAAAPIATEAKVPMIVMAAGTSGIPQKSPYIVRTSFTLPQNTAPVADWAVKTKLASAVTLVTDFGPGFDAEKVFVKRFTAGGGKVLDSLRVPLQNPDFAPFIQKVKDLKPAALFVFVPSGVGSAVMKQYQEKGLAAAGIRIIGTGDLLDDDLMPGQGDEVNGVVTSQHYSAAHDSPENKAYVAAFSKLGKGMRPNFMSVGGYDGMHLLFEALKKTGGDTDADKLITAMKGLKWTSPRGPMSIDPETRDVIQNVYIRKAEKVGGQYYNVEFDKVEQLKDPGT